MVTEDSLETINKELNVKPKEEKKSFRHKWGILIGMIYVSIILFGFMWGYYQGTTITYKQCDAWKEPIVYKMNEADLNKLIDKNFFVEGLNALYQVQMQNDQVIYEAIQDLNKRVS